MKRSEVRFKKKLRGIYKQCIDACSWNKNTKSFRDSLTVSIKSLTSEINGSHN